MALSPTTAGGYIVPLSLDPAILLTNDGGINPLRQFARVEQITTNSWNGISSAGVSAEWKSENAQAADATPTLGQPTVPVFLGDADVPVSYEVEQDATNLVAELTRIMTDSAAVLQNAAFATGSGVGQPAGLITGATTSPVSTAGAFTAAHVYALQAALPARFQPGPRSWAIWP